MRRKTETTARTARRLWVIDARRRCSVVERDRLSFRWHARTPAFGRILRAVFTGVILIAAARCADAAFDQTTVSAQAAAMGGASLAGQGGDSASLFLNPAAGAGLENPEAYFMYDQLYAGLSGVGSLGQGFASFAVPTKLGTVGVGFSDFTAAGLLDDRVVGVTFARRWFDAVDFGITGKYLYQNYQAGSDPTAASDPVFGNGTARSAFALDAGLIVPVTSALHVGLAVRNINQPDMGLSSVDRVPRQVQAGLVYDLKADALRLTADYTYTSAESGTLTDRSEPGIGLEKSYVRDIVKFRFGVTLDQVSGGIGLQLGPIGFDYTFLLSRTLLSNNGGTQLVGLRYRFGDPVLSSSRRQ